MSIRRQLELQKMLNARAARKRSLGKTLDMCDRHECRAPKSHKLRYRLWPKGIVRGLTGAHEGDMSLQLCEAHARAMLEAGDPRGAAREFIGDDLWAEVVKSFARAGWAEPDRDSAEVYPERLQ